MRLVSLRLRGFRLFAAEQVLKFPPQGLIGITGDSGAGKTSVMQAIAFALGYSSFAANRQQSWIEGSEKLQVDLELGGPEEMLLVRRGAVTQVCLNGTQVARGATEVNAYLQTFFGLDATQLQALTFQPQRGSGAFLALKNDARRVFLTTILGLQKYETGLKRIGEDLATISGDLRARQATLEALQSAVPEKVWCPLGADELYIKDIAGIDGQQNHYGSDLQQLFEPLYRAAAERVRAAGARLETIWADLGAAEQQLKNEHDALRAAADRDCRVANADAQAERDVLVVPQAAAPADDVQEKRLQRVKDRLKEIRNELHETSTNFATCVRNESEIRKDIEYVGRQRADQEQRLRSLETNKCPVCGGPYQQDLSAERAKLDAIDGRLREFNVRQLSYNADAPKLEARIAELRAQRDKFEALEAQLTQIIADERNARMTDYTALMVGYHAARDAIQKRLADRVEVVRQKMEASLAEIRDFHARRTEDLRKQRYVAEAEQAAANKELTEIKTAAARVAAELREKQLALRLYEEAEANRRKLLARVDEARQAVEDQQRVATEFEDLRTATKAFLSVINEEILAEIADETNDILAALPNAAGIRIAFRTERVSGQEMKPEIRAVVSVGPQDDIDPVSQLSGGQLTSLELATDRAVAAVLRRRRGGTRIPTWVCLDEAFNGHDAQTREACRDVLARLASDAQVIVIDHASEFKAGFDKLVQIVATPKGAQIIT